MNDYKELIAALKSCQHIASNCIDCKLSNSEHYNPITHDCEVHLHNIAANAIEQLAKERDAAVKDLATVVACGCCKYHNDLKCQINGECEWESTATPTNASTKASSSTT